MATTLDAPESARTLYYVPGSDLSPLSNARSFLTLTFGLSCNQFADLLSLVVFADAYLYDRGWDLETIAFEARKRSAARKRKEGGRKSCRGSGGGRLGSVSGEACT